MISVLGVAADELVVELGAAGLLQWLSVMSAAAFFDG
jgi:hypothetical protein